jgi:hypothetical protein
VLRLYLKNQNTAKSFWVESLERERERERESATRQVWVSGCCETVTPFGGMGGGGASTVASHCVAAGESCRSVRKWTQAEEAALLKDVTRQLLKIQQTEKT